MHKLLSGVAIFIAAGVFGQHFCRTTEAQNEWFAKHPELRATFERYQQEAADLDQEAYKTGYKLAQRSQAAPNYTIPIVFHILHTGGGENISDAQVQDAVSILTEDFNRLNADTSNVVIQFKNLIGDAQIDFVLATKDPSGNCTNGIVRHWDANTDWSGAQTDFAYTWPPTRYLNIYVVRTMGGGAAGYTFLPGSGIPANMDAIVILNSYVGSIGTGNAGTSRALTHEVGHWLNLPHVWGGTNQPGVACGNDGVSDTPITKGYTSCNLSNSAICNTGIVENVQNYMDYAYCQRMFTIGQAARMQTAINSPINGRNNLSTPANLALTGVTNPGVGCIPKLDINALPSLTVCSGKALTLVSFTSNAIPTSYSWTATNSGIVANPTSSSTSITFANQGVTIIDCIAANANGSSSKTVAVLVNNGVTDITSSNSEGFDNSLVNLPASWTVVNPTTPAEKWEIVTNAAVGGNCMYVPGELLPPNSIEILQSPSYDFKNNAGAEFSFKYAYARYSLANNDVFKVQASKDCGGTWTDIWVPTNATLAQGSGGVTGVLYTTPFNSEWKQYILTNHPNFTPFKNEEHVTIRFFFQEDINGDGYGNRFYLDQISFATPVGINELGKSIGFTVYPNPSSSEFNIGFNLSDAAKIKYEVTSVTGAVLISENEKTLSAGTHEIKINENKTLSTGIYFVNFELNGVKIARKLVIN